MAKKDEWFKAQKHERYFWEEQARAISDGVIKQLDWYGWKANEFEKLLFKLNINLLSNNPNILEIGSGPIGVVNYLNYGTRYSIDPLEDFYKTNSDLIKLRDNKVIYLKGTGESLNLENNNFSVVIIDNVIDHCYDPEIVLKEIFRTLNNIGIMYLSVNVHTLFGAKLHQTLNVLGLDIRHPHTYTTESISNLLEKNRFKIIYRSTENYKEIRKKNIESSSVKSKIKGYFGLSEMIYYAICMKE